MPYRSSRMLVVDDFATMARVMRTLAGRIGFANVDICHDGETALRMMAARTYDFVLCDIKMDPVDGVAFAHRLRAEPHGKDCVVVLTTADRVSANAAVAAGVLHLVDALLLKPFKSADLDATLRDIVGRRRAPGGDHMEARAAHTVGATMASAHAARQGRSS